MSNQAKVAEFMTGGGQEVRDFPTIPERLGAAYDEGHQAEFIIAATMKGFADMIKETADTYKSEQLLSMALLSEEVAELFQAIAENDLVEIADGSTDVKVIVYGIDNRYGLPSQVLFDEVHRSNMSKFVDGRAVRDAAGKIQKPPTWSPPRIQQVLYGQTED